MKKVICGTGIIIIIFVMSILVYSFIRTSHENTQKVTGFQEESDYKYYEGIWSTGGAEHRSIIENGGTELEIKIQGRNELEGYLYSQQEISERIAEIEGIEGAIQNGELKYFFTDDGWGNCGELHIQFRQDEIYIEVKDFMLNDENTSGFGISGSYSLTRSREIENDIEITNNAETAGNESLKKYDTSWSEAEVHQEIEKRNKYLQQCSFYEEVVRYLENEREVRDISMLQEPLYATDSQYYQKEDFEDVPPLILYLARNEIYARHGYIFQNEDLENYFMGQLWYLPSIAAEEFDAVVLNEFEKKNIQLLMKLDCYGRD